MPDVRAYLRRRTSGYRRNTEEKTMIPKDTYFVLYESEYRRSQARKDIAAQRGSGSRSSWLRRMAAADRSH
jgi:hypothetical protein